MFYSDSHVFKFFKIVQVYLRLASFRAFIFFPKRMSDKNLLETSKKKQICLHLVQSSVHA